MTINFVELVELWTCCNSSWKTTCSYSQYHDCWWPGDMRSQGISSHGSDLVVFEYSTFITRRLNIEAWTKWLKICKGQFKMHFLDFCFCFVFWFQFHWSLLQNVQMTIYSIVPSSVPGMTCASGYQAIPCDNPICWYIHAYASPNVDELT